MTGRHLAGLGVLICGLTASACGAPGSRPPIGPVLATAGVSSDADDPAIWISPVSPDQSLIFGTDKIEGFGGLYVFGLDGSVQQHIAPLDRPNNVDVEYGLSLSGSPTDIVVVTERSRQRLRVFGIPREGGPLKDLAPAGVPVLAGQPAEAAEPMGIALYRRPSDGAIFAIVSPKTGPSQNYLWEYRLEDNGSGGVRGVLVRRFGAFSRIGSPSGDVGEIESVVVDDPLGFVYYSDEGYGIRKYRADPDAPDAATELAAFGTSGYLGDREGLAIYETGAGTGYLVSSDQVAGNTRLMIYPREGLAGQPHQHPRLAMIPTLSDETDGLEVTNVALPRFPAGMLVMMNSGSHNFWIYDWTVISHEITKTRN